MNPEDIIKMTEAYKKVKEKLDPVGQEDGDINNDGETDSSDQYLAKRRKAIGKAMKKESSCDKGKIREEDKVECPKCEGKGCSHCDDTGYHMKEDVEQTDEARIVPGFMGADGKATFNPTKKDYDSNKEYQSMKKKGVAPKVKLRGFGSNKDKGNMGNPAARAALGRKMNKEDVEQIDELKKSTLASYIKKATRQHGADQREYGSEFELGPRSPNLKSKSSLRKWDAHFDKLSKIWDRSDKRKRGIDRASDKLAKEEVEQVDELKKSTLASYIKKSAGDVSSNAYHIGKDDTEVIRGRGKKLMNRRRGIDRASDRLSGKMQKKQPLNVFQRAGTKKYNAEGVFSERELIALEAAGVLENKQTQGATAPETMQDKIKGGNSKKFAAMHKHPKDDSHSIADYDEKGHDDASKAGRATKQAPARRADNLNNGDSKSPKKV